jgi:diguanylate cyclase (GGDEF)-like protein
VRRRWICFLSSGKKIFPSYKFTWITFYQGMLAVAARQNFTSSRKIVGKTRLLPYTLLLITICVLMTVVSVSMIGGVVVDQISDDRDAAVQVEQDLIRRLQAAIGEADAATYGYTLTSQPEFLSSYFQAVKLLSNQGVDLLGRLDPVYVLPQQGEGEPAVKTLHALLAAWDIAVGLVQSNRPANAATALNTAHARLLVLQLSEMLQARFTRNAEVRMARDDAAAIWLMSLRGATLLSIAVSIVVMIGATKRIASTIASGQAARQQVEQLFTMGDMLQSAVDLEDTNAVLRATAVRLMPGLSGALYVFNNSRDRLDLATQWGDPAQNHIDHMTPAACWALKRGKPHVNEVHPGSLRCVHTSKARVALDIPMVARGQLHGMLEIVAEGLDAADRLEAARPIAVAIGDVMSLALSNAALRDQLRNQALHDGLTGLYNRRFLGEVLDRLCLDSERRGSSIALIMLDLDHFKRLNDTHGHAAGDAVLREVATTIQAAVRGTDLACRYGGEEFLILLPDCELEVAEAKAELLRHRIANLILPGGVSVTGSFGIAALPATSLAAQTLVTDADAALYQAKTSGRDRVMIAPAREARRMFTAVNNAESAALTIAD